MTGSIDNAAQWLLRVGIDSAGHIDLNHLWDIGVRGAILVDLRLSDVITDEDSTFQITTYSTGIDYQDEAIKDLLSRPGQTEAGWISGGHFGAAAVARALVTTGEWSRHLDPMASGLHSYRAPAHANTAVSRRLAQIIQPAARKGTVAEKVVATIADALRTAPPPRYGRNQTLSDTPLVNSLPAGIGEILKLTLDAISERAANARAAGFATQMTQGSGGRY